MSDSTLIDRLAAANREIADMQADHMIDKLVDASREIADLKRQIELMQEKQSDIKIIKRKTEYAGVVLRGFIIKGDWEGDPDLPPVHVKEPYVDDLEVFIDGIERYDWFTDAAINEFVQVMLEDWEGEG